MMMVIAKYFIQQKGMKLINILTHPMGEKVQSKNPLEIVLGTGRVLTHGICVTNKFSNLFLNNFTPLLSHLTRDFQHWTPLPLSLAGCLTCVKMNVLSRFRYLFQCIPIFYPKVFFSAN